MSTGAGIREHTKVVGSCGGAVGVVDGVEGGSIRLKDGPLARGGRRYLSLHWVDSAPREVRLDLPREWVESELRSTPCPPGRVTACERRGARAGNGLPGPSRFRRRESCFPPSGRFNAPGEAAGRSFPRPGPPAREDSTVASGLAAPPRPAIFPSGQPRAVRARCRRPPCRAPPGEAGCAGLAVDKPRGGPRMNNSYISCLK